MAKLSVVAPLPADLDDRKLAYALSRIDPAGFDDLGWSPSSLMWSPSPDHPLFGYSSCRARGCDAAISPKRMLCGNCLRGWKRAGEPPFEQFHRAPRADEVLCLVCRTVEHERPAHAHGLCIACHRVRTGRSQTIDAYMAGDDRFPAATPRPSFGVCQVDACDLLAANNNGLCMAHTRRWTKVSKDLDFDSFCRRTAPVRASVASVSFKGIDDLPVAQLILTLQLSAAAQRQVLPRAVRDLAAHLRDAAVSDLEDLDPDDFSSAPTKQLLTNARRALQPLRTPEQELRRDEWNLVVFGHKGKLSFVGNTSGRRIANGRRRAEPIRQMWLRHTAQDWAFEKLPTLRSAQPVKDVVRALGVLSTVLAERDDGGERPEVLSRADIDSFLRHVRLLHRAELVSDGWLSDHTSSVRNFLNDLSPLTEEGHPAHGLSAGFRMRASDVPNRPERDREEAGDALDREVVNQLLADESLALLAQVAGEGMVTWLQVQAEVGRRTSELADVRWNCLDYDEHIREDGMTERSPVLVHDMPKVGRKNCRLPINRETEQMLLEQQGRTRSAYPHTPSDVLRLWPRERLNADGTNPMSTETVAVKLRRWVKALPRLDSPDLDPDGDPIPFDRRRVFAYAFRHTYAQRHVDAGTPVEVLAELMGHESMETTRGYFRVSASARRDATNRLASFQVDRNGTATRPGATELLMTEATRDAVGRVAVPMGSCVEPSNLAARGTSCPFRHRCLGCDHFRTDPSYLPELRVYLNQLLADRERLAVAVPELAEWAREDAQPRDGEVEAVRQLIHRCEELVDGLDPEDREAVEDALKVMRKGRAQLGNSTITFLGLVRPPTPTVFPRQHAAGQPPTTEEQ